MRPAVFFALLGVATALGALLVGRVVLFPGLGAHPELLDANFAKAIAEPIHLRLAEIVLAGHLVVAALARPWIGTRWATSLGLLLVACSAVHRFLLLPAMYRAWSQADLVAGRPVEHILEADRLEFNELLLIATMIVLDLALLAAHAFAGDTAAAAPARSGERVPAPSAL